jgi:hypothetical protein
MVLPIFLKNLTEPNIWTKHLSWKLYNKFWTKQHYTYNLNNLQATNVKKSINKIIFDE